MTDTNANPYNKGTTAVNNAGKVGRVARAGSTMRLARYARIFRVVRLVRVIRLFRVCMTDGVHHVDQAPSRPSTVGKLLAKKVTQRIVALIIAMILVLPYLEVAPSNGAVSMQVRSIILGYHSTPGLVWYGVLLSNKHVSQPFLPCALHPPALLQLHHSLDHSTTTSPPPAPQIRPVLFT